MSNTTSTGRRLGYARVSTDRQDEDRQVAALIEAGIDERDIFTDHGVSGAKTSRPELDRLLAYVRPGDTITVQKLDRLGRSTAHLATLIADLGEREIIIRSLAEGIDTSTTMGRAMLQIAAVFAEVEREYAKERTTHALKVKREQGITGGRPRALDSRQAKIARDMYNEGEKVADIAKTLKTSRPTIYRYLDMKTA